MNMGGERVMVGRREKEEQGEEEESPVVYGKVLKVTKIPGRQQWKTPSTTNTSTTQQTTAGFCEKRELVFSKGEYE
ncbi:hypothetical protein E2C01_000363 [Portunus trituberculatus]|uniref:Uncharacterized protein n=1 Tax=Portunus trituberculatus TaxID=210409 RepID=A0A5B7CH19_PORTR|nr:hypothetical protein [Portunus trituberculatus]